MGDPLAYFLTFHTHGTWLHGHADGSVDRDHRSFGQPFAPRDAVRQAEMQRRMAHPPLRLDDTGRRIVRDTIRAVCEYRGWRLHALHARTTHVHVVVSAPRHSKERVINDLKAWCTRRLREAGLIARDRKPWAEHGSTRHIWNEKQLAEKVDYTLNQQGDPLPESRWPE